MQGVYIPASVPLTSFNSSKNASFGFFEKRGDKQVPVPFQLVQNKGAVIHWLIAPLENHQSKRVFVLRRGAEIPPIPPVKATRKDGALTLEITNKNLLRYQYEMVYPPKGVDSAF